MVTAGTFLVEATAPDGGARQATVTVAPKATQTVTFKWRGAATPATFPALRRRIGRSRKE
jgi:hypothetical protein